MMQSRLAQLRQHPAYRYLAGAFLILAALLLAWQLADLGQNYRFGSPGTTDFIEYWSAGQLLRRGENPYDQERLRPVEEEQTGVAGEPTVMWNPPWLLIWLYPLLLLPFPAAALAWFFLSAGLIFTSAALIWRALASSPRAEPALGLAWLASFVFLPTLFTLKMGQTSSILLLGVAGFLYFVCRDRPALAGAFVTLTSIKPHVLYLLWLTLAWWVIAGRRWKTVAGAVALLLPTLAVLTMLWPGWLGSYQAALAEPPLKWQTPTLGGVLRLWVFSGQPSAQFWPAAGTAAALLAYLLLRRPALDWRTALGPLLLVSVPTAAYGWSFDQIVLLVPYLGIVRWALEDAARKRRGVVLGGLGLVAGVMLAQNLLGLTGYRFFWVPFALAALYGYARPSAEQPAPSPRGTGPGRVTSDE